MKINKTETLLLMDIVYQNAQDELAKYDTTEEYLATQHYKERANLYIKLESRFYNRKRRIDECSPFGILETEFEEINEEKQNNPIKRVRY